MGVGLSAMYLHDPKWKDVLFPPSLFIGHYHVWKSLSCNGVFLCALNCGSCDKQ